MIADITINKPPKTRKGKPHESDPRNIHAKILLTTRNVNSKGFEPKKNRRWNQQNLLERWRIQWELHANAALQKAGRDERIDHRSLEAQGLQRPAADKKTSKSSQETKKTDYKLISVHQEIEVLVKAYAVWLKSQQLEGQNKALQNFKDIFEKEFENKPKNKKDYKNYVKWAETISQIQDEFLKQLNY